MHLIARKARPLAAVLLLGALLAAACDWPTYHGTTARNGSFGGGSAVRSMSLAWQQRLDGAVYASPVVVGSMLVVATENNTLYGIDAASGAIRWQRHVATPVRLTQLAALNARCGNIDPLGITGTPAYDSATNRVFAVAETLSAGKVVHQLVAVNPSTGAQVMSVPVSPPVPNSAAHQQRGALTVTGGRVYIPYGGLAGDCGQYRGTVVSRATDGSGTTTSYTVPTAREAGIWTPPGATVTPSGTLLVAVGNGATTLTGNYDGSDAVIELRPGLPANPVLANFHPATWRTDNRDDLDLGSSGPTLVSSGGNNYALQIGKLGTAYVLRRAGLGLVRSAPVCAAFGGSAVVGSTVYVPCSDGVRAVSVGSDGSLRVLWKANGGDGQSPMGSPVVYGPSVLTPDFRNGRLYALNATNGTAATSFPVGTLTRFATPALDTGRAYVGTTSGVVAVALQ